MSRLATALIATTMLAAACGDSGGTDTTRSDDTPATGLSSVEQELSNAIRDSILEDPDPDSPFGEAEASCIGEQAVSEFGVEGLLELGVTVDNANPADVFEGATDEQIDTVIDVTLRCVDFTTAFVEAAAGDVSSESAQCLGDGLEETGLFKPLIRAEFRGEEFDFTSDPDVTSALFALITECLSADEILDLGSDG